MATGGVNIKMGVSGVAQFKQSISQARQNMKTLDAQLKLTEKQYKATGDAETYMAQKTEQLKAKLEEQKAVADNAQKALDDMTKRGVDKSSKAFQDMIRTLATAKGDMLDTEMALQGISESSDQAADGVSEMNSQLANVGQGISWQNVTSGLESITGKLEQAAKTAFNFGKKLVNATLGAGEWADELVTEAKTLGLTPQELQAMRYTSNIIDTSVESIVSAQKKLKKGLGSNDEGVMGGLLELLGEGYDPRGKDWETVFWDAGEALMKFGNETEKEVYAQKLFGRSWNDLIPLFEAGRKEYEETNASWNVLSDEQLESLTKMDDEYQKLNAQFENLKTTALSEFAEPMQKAMQKINELLTKFTEWLQSEEGQKFVDGVINKVNEGLDWIIKNKDDVVTALTAIAGGFALIKITTLAANIGKFVSGLSGLFGGKAATSAAANAGTTTASAGIGAGGLLGLGGAAAIVAGFVAAADRRNNHPEDVRGTKEYLAAQSAGAEKLLAEYLSAEKAKASFDWMSATEAEAAAIQAKVEATRQKLMEAEGGADALKAYSDWRQENSYGNDYWELPEALAQAAEKMDQAAEEFTGGSDSTRQSNSEMTEAANGIKGLPAETAEAVRQALSGAQVRIDGGLLSAYVGQVFAQWVANQGSP